MDQHTLFLILHLFGVAIGAGGAFMTDSTVVTALRDNMFTKNEFAILHRAGLIVFFGLALLIVSGIGLFLDDPERYIASSKFIAKMIIVGVLTVNGFILHGAVLPLLEKHLQTHLLKNKEFRKHIPAVLAVGAVSSTSWAFAIVLGALRSIPITVVQMLLVWVVATFLAYTVGFVVYRVRYSRS